MKFISRRRLKLIMVSCCIYGMPKILFFFKHDNYEICLAIRVTEKLHGLITMSGTTFASAPPTLATLLHTYEDTFYVPFPGPIFIIFVFLIQVTVNVGSM